MGFFDKIKGKINEVKDANPNFKTAMARMNNRAAFCGNVNVKIKDGDFDYGSYINVEGSKCVIYNTKCDYFFDGNDVAGFDLLGDGMKIKVGSEEHLSLRFLISFKDGKKAELDIIVPQVDKLKAALGL